MFFTCVASRRNSRPSGPRVEPVARRRLDAPCASCSTPTRARPPLHALARAEVPHRVHVVVLGQRLRQRILRAGDDVDDAGRHVRRLEHADRNPSPRAARAPTGSRPPCSPSRSPARRARRSRAADASSGHAMPITPIGSFIASATPRIGTLCTAPSYLSAHARIREQPRDRRVDLARAVADAGHRVDARRELVRARREILGDVVEDLRAVVPGRRAPSPRAACAASTALRMSLRLPSATSPSSSPFGARDATRVAGVGARLLAADEQLGRAIDRRDAAIARRRAASTSSRALRRALDALRASATRTRRRVRDTPTSLRARPRARIRSRDSRRIPPPHRTDSSSSPTPRPP